MPAIHIARNRVDPCSIRNKSTLSYIGCHGNDTPNVGRCMVQNLAQTEDFDSRDVCKTESEDLSEKSVLSARCSKMAHCDEMNMRCLNAAFDSNFLHRGNASSTVTDQSNRSLPVCAGSDQLSLPAVEDGHNQTLPGADHHDKSLPAAIMADRSIRPPVDDTTQMTKTEESDLCCDVNQFSVLASQQTVADSDQTFSEVEVSTHT